MQVPVLSSTKTELGLSTETGEFRGDDLMYGLEVQGGMKRNCSYFLIHFLFGSCVRGDCLLSTSGCVCRQMKIKSYIYKITFRDARLLLRVSDGLSDGIVY